MQRRKKNDCRTYNPIVGEDPVTMYWKWRNLGSEEGTTGRK